MKTIKCKYYEGCMNFSTTIDDTDLTDMNINKLKNYIQQMIPLIDDVSVLQDVFCRVLETHGIMDEYSVCEECGDSCCKYVLELEVNE